VKKRRSSVIALPSDIPADWQRVAEMQKELLTWPNWPDPPLPPSGLRAVARREELHTTAGETISVVMPLAEAAGGPGLEGVRLRLTASPFRREHNVSATLEVEGGRSFVTIGRIDAWPADPHVNGRARKHPALRHLPPMVEGHHIHRFADNASLGREAFAPTGNLPAAAPLEQSLQSFRDFLRIVQREFRIDGLEEFPPPDWRSLV
jgi:hypothetical protein